MVNKARLLTYLLLLGSHLFPGEATEATEVNTNFFEILLSESIISGPTADLEPVLQVAIEDNEGNSHTVIDLIWSIFRPLLLKMRHAGTDIVTLYTLFYNSFADKDLLDRFTGYLGESYSLFGFSPDILRLLGVDVLESMEESFPDLQNRRFTGPDGYMTPDREVTIDTDRGEGERLFLHEVPAPYTVCGERVFTTAELDRAFLIAVGAE